MQTLRISCPPLHPLHSPSLSPSSFPSHDYLPWSPFSPPPQVSHLPPFLLPLVSLPAVWLHSSGRPPQRFCSGQSHGYVPAHYGTVGIDTPYHSRETENWKEGRKREGRSQRVCVCVGGGGINLSPSQCCPNSRYHNNMLLGTLGAHSNHQHA